MAYQYTQRIADQWQQMYGRRPIINVSSSSSLVPGPRRPLIDPRVDMASAKIQFLRHNDWIMLPSEQDKPVVER